MMKHWIVSLSFALFPLIARVTASDASRSLENVFEARIREAELAGDRAQVAAICREWYASGQYSPGVLNWNYNALMSVEANGILFTQNETDTYPAYLLQYALQVRSDVTVLNLQLLEQAAYRNLVSAGRLEGIPAGASLGEFLNSVLNRAAWTNVAAYFGVMNDKNMLQADKGKLYLTGLALKFSATPFDNIATLRYNVESRFHTDYLELPLAPESQPDLVAKINLNYIPALSLLHRHYLGSGETVKAAHLEQLALKIARDGQREAEVRALFQQPTAETAPESGMTPKALEKPMKKVAAQLYAAETELTNGQYELFLQDLLKNKDFEQLALCRTQKTDWRSLLPEGSRNLSDALLFKHGHPDAADMPVQNISHDAAQRYCEWITRVYNTSAAKKKFKKVVFRLPTKAEWILAASGGFNAPPYAWGGYYVRNAKGCYLCNLNATEPCGDCPADKDGGANDGGFFPVPATSYFPNAFGLYNTSGNVAEMLQAAGKTMGGSWQDDAYHCQILTEGAATLPSPAVGFRVFMEVVEE